MRVVGGEEKERERYKGMGIGDNTANQIWGNKEAEYPR